MPMTILPLHKGYHKKKVLKDNLTLYMIGVSTDRAGSGLCPTRTRLETFEWVKTEPETDPKCQSDQLVRVVSGCRVIPVSFDFYRWCRYFGRIRRDLARSRRDLVGSGLDLDEISPNLIQFDGFQVNFRRITPNIARFCMFSSKNVRILLEVSGIMIRLGCSGFRRGSPPTDPKATTRHRLSKWSVRAIFGSGSSGFLGLVGYPGWVDSPSI